MGEKKQQFHLEPDRGLLNDPNGLAYYKGKYYVFFQWNRFSKDHSYKEWGMFTSADMVRWTFEGSALLPDQTYDMCGIYSGSGLVINDRLYLFYTGNVKKDGRRESHQCMAVTENGKKFLKLGSIAETPPGFTSHFRDPKIFRTGAGGYCMVTGAQRENGKGALALFRSDDALSWTYAGTPALSEDYEMIECPDLFRLDGRYVLLYCPQNRDNENDRDIKTGSLSFLSVRSAGHHRACCIRREPALRQAFYHVHDRRRHRRIPGIQPGAEGNRNVHHRYPGDTALPERSASALPAGQCDLICSGLCTHMAVRIQ